MRYIAILVLILAGCAKDLSPQDDHRQAADELLRLLEVDKTMQTMAVLMADAMVKQNPKMTPYRDVVIEWSNETMSWAEVGEQFVSIYAEAFSERELRDLIAFYRSPTGKKSIELIPNLMKKGGEIGHQRAMAGQADLQARLRNRANELNLEQKP